LPRAASAPHPTKTLAFYDLISERYPPKFVTDGNAGSFETHGRELAEKLKALGVPVAPLFFPLSEPPFPMNTSGR